MPSVPLWRQPEYVVGSRLEIFNPARSWPEAIDNAISASSIMVLIFSANSNDVVKELTLAMNSNVIVIPFKIDDIAPKGIMRYYLSNTHWLNAMNPSTKKQIRNPVDTVSSFMTDKATSPGVPFDQDSVPGVSVNKTTTVLTD